MDAETKYERSSEVIDGVRTSIFETDQLEWYSRAIQDTAEPEKSSAITFRLWKAGLIHPEIDVIGNNEGFQVYYSPEDLPTRQIFNYRGKVRLLNPNWEEFKEEFTNKYFTTLTEPFLRSSEASNTRIYRVSHRMSHLDLQVFIDEDMKRKYDVLDIWHVRDNNRKHVASIVCDKFKWKQLSLEERMKNVPASILEGRTFV